MVWVAIKALDNVLKSLKGRMKTLLSLEVRSSWLQILPNTHERGNLLIIISLAALLQADSKQRTHQAEAHRAIKPQNVGPNPARPDGYLSFSSIKACFISNLIYISYK